MKKEKTVVTVETLKRTIVYSKRRETSAFCDDCGEEALMLSTDEAGKLMKTTAREIFRLVEAGKIHFLETADGALLICRRSLEID